VRRAEYREAGDSAIVKQLADDQPGFDGLPDTDVVRDEKPYRVEPQCHQERHQLIGARLDSYRTERAEGSSRGSKPEPQSVPQQSSGLMVTRGCRIGPLELGRNHRFKGGKDACRLILGAADRAQEQQLLV
jgi:hypothetical protein